MAQEIEVFQDLYLKGPLSRRAELREALIGQASAPWAYDAERSAKMLKSAVTSDDVVLFRRSATLGLPEAGLTLLANDNGYYVPNIVPTQSGSLTYSQYNSILEEFNTSVVQPTVGHFGFTVQSTKSNQTLEDWISADAAQKLRTFSSCANKSTGADHPMDQRRWYAFIVAVHRTGGDFDTERLSRWLIESEGWWDELAHRLAGDFESALSLLKYYDEN